MSYALEVQIWNREVLCLIFFRITNVQSKIWNREVGCHML